MATHVCPWWAVPFTINPPYRRLIHDPRKIVGPYVAAGMTALDVGCGFGWFTVPMAGMVGDGGKVIAVDLQRQMLDMVRRRAEKAGVAERIVPRECEKDRLGIETLAGIDFALVFAALHEMPDQETALGDIFKCLKPNGKMLLAEPPLHITKKKFAKEMAIAQEVGFRLIDRPKLRWSHAALLAKGE